MYRVNWRKSYFLLLLILLSFFGILANNHNSKVENCTFQGNIFEVRNQDAVLEWKSSLGVPGDSIGLIGSSAVLDVDNDGNFEVILGSNESLRCFNGVDGSVKWVHDTTSPLAKSSPVVSDLDNDGQPEIVYGSGGNRVECVDAATGVREWIYTDAGSGCQTTPAVGDIDKDNQMEVVFGCNDDKVYCINGITGVEEWTYATLGYVRSSPAIGDIDEDGDLEVIIGSDDNHVYCINGTGDLEWSYLSGGDIWFNSIVLADVNNDGLLEVIFGCYDGKVYCLYGSTGLLFWSSSTYSSFMSVAPIIDDVNNDGKAEVIIGCTNSYIYCLNGETGSQIWSFDTGSSSVKCSPTIGDIDADDELEILIGSDNNKLHCLKGINGQEEWSYLVGGYVRSRPKIADIDKDGLVEILFGSDESYLYCVTTNAPFIQDLKINFELTLEFLNTTMPLENDLGLQVNCSVTNSSLLNWVYLCENSSGSFANRSMALGLNGEWTYNVDLTGLNRGDYLTFSFYANQTPNQIIKNDNYGLNFTIIIGDFFPPFIIFAKSLEYLNTTYLEDTINWIEINCTVSDRTAISWVYLCENSTGTFINRSMILGINGEWSYNLNVSGINEDGELMFWFYANDSYNNIGINNNQGFNFKLYSREEIPPIINFQISLDYLSQTTLTYLDNYLQINCTVSDDSDILWVYLSENSTGTFTYQPMILGINGEWTHIIDISLINQPEILGFLFYACDEFNNIGINNNSGLLFTLEITEPAIIDEIAPIIIINSPTINEMFGQYSPAFDLTIIEDNLDVTWYTLDEGITNVTFSGLTGTINQTLWEYFPAGHVTIVFYAKDLNENIGSKAVTIVKEMEEISGYHLILFIGIIGVTSTLILYKKLKKIKN